ncbi:MAG TPA: hypothetical protein V6C99_01820 [Oculatellaceae cyanobacterium]|jgi:hypothetical protein
MTPLKTLTVLLSGLLLLTAAQISHADSTVIDGPGFKIEERKGWFGRKSTVYQDALGNTVERKTGLFGRSSNRTKIFGSEAVTKGNQVTVTAPNGKPLVQRKKTLFGGEQTHIDGNGIVESIKNLMGP